MKFLIFLIGLILCQAPAEVKAQYHAPLGTRAAKLDSVSKQDLKIFHEKSAAFIQSIQDTTYQLSSPDLKNRINNFILFTENGLIMKDLLFHSVESCKAEILADAQLIKIKTPGKKWISVDMESQVDDGELLAILRFLREKEIDYYFRSENEFLPMIRNK